MPTYWANCYVRINGSVTIEADDEADARKKVGDMAVEDILKNMPTYENVGVDVEDCDEVK